MLNKHESQILLSLELKKKQQLLFDTGIHRYDGITVSKNTSDKLL